MSSILFVVALILIVAAVVGGVVFIRRRPRKVPVLEVTKSWQALQKNCASQKTWPLAIIEADNLLDKVLKARKYKGKTTGERLVSAQHQLTSNDSVWFGHKLRNKIVHENVNKLKKHDVLEALGGFRQALKDLGALKK